MLRSATPTHWPVLSLSPNLRLRLTSDSGRQATFDSGGPDGYCRLEAGRGEFSNDGPVHFVSRHSPSRTKQREQSLVSSRMHVLRASRQATPERPTAGVAMGFR